LREYVIETNCFQLDWNAVLFGGIEMLLFLQNLAGAFYQPTELIELEKNKSVKVEKEV
jgi:hypothetical protein